MQTVVGNEGVLVVDNFVTDPDKVRASALAAGFGTWKPNKGEVGSSIYDGMSFWGDHGTLLTSLTRTMGYALIPNSMFFRVTNKDTEPAYVHSDREAGNYTAIVYLSRHEKISGTGFFTHKRTGMTIMPPLAELSKRKDYAQFKDEMVKAHPDDWTLRRFVPGEYNRALIFRAPLFHARIPRHGFATTPEEGRMVWVCHFNLLGEMNG